METASRVWLLVAVGAATAGVAGCRGCKPPAPARSDGGAAPATAWLSGRVVDRRDRPVPEARVVAFSGSSAAPLETATDLEGRFRLAGLRSESHRLLVEAAGFPTAEQAAVAAPSDEVTIRLDGEGQSILGKVVSAAGPVAGARVLLASDDGGPIRETQTRAAGGFAFGGLGAGLYALRATHEGTASATARAVPAGEVKGAAPVSLELRPGGGIPGRVIDDAGTSLGDVEVRAESAAGAVGEDPLPTLVRTAASGGFGVGPLLPGSYRLSASRAGSVLRRAPIVEVAPPAVLPQAVLELVRGARVTGRVLDPRGAPAAGARVRCVASTFEDLTVQIGPLPLAAEAAAMPSGAGRALGTTRLGVADRDGRFVVTDLVPGRYRIEVSHPGAEPLRTGELVIAPAEKRDAGVLTLRTGLPVVGRVMDEGGTPVEGARVVVGEAGAPSETAGLSALTDAQGRFTLALPIGGYRLSATAPGRGAAQKSIQVGPGATPAIEIRLLRTEARLEGLVRDNGGRPLARARLSAWTSGSTNGEAQLGTATADVGGHFTIERLPAGDVRLEVQHPDYPVFTQGVTGGQYALVTVPFPGGIAGEVRTKATGAAVPRAQITAVGPADAKATAEVRKGSSFRLMRLVPGTWRLSVSSPGFRSVEREVDVGPSATLGEPSVRELRIDLDAGP